MSLKSTLKGFLGETVINVAMWLKLDKDVYHRINNVTLPLADGGSTQIDHIIVSTYGIFVIETKNYAGWIFGSERQAQWTQSLYGKKYKFQNPLRQNYLHIKTLADLLGLDVTYFHSMIAFIGECELKTRDKLPEHVLTSGMVSYVKSKQEKILSAAEVTAIIEEIDSNRFSKSWRTHRQHRAYLKDKHEPTPNPQHQQSRTPRPQSPNPTSQDTTGRAVGSTLDPDRPMYCETDDIAQHKQATRVKDETPRWSGQTAVEEVKTVATIVATANSENATQTTAAADQVALTPFDVSTSANNSTDSDTADSVTPRRATKTDDVPSCPKCGGAMVRRMAKKGKREGQSFYGCGNFPKCRGIVNVS